MLPHWICQTSSVAAPCTVEVEKRRPPFDRVDVFLFSFFPLNSLLMMMTPADPRGRQACRSFTPLLHLYAAHTWRVPSWMEWGALQALKPPPSRLTCGTFLSSPRTPMQFTLGLTNYSLKTSGMWVVHNWHVSANRWKITHLEGMCVWASHSCAHSSVQQRLPTVLYHMLPDSFKFTTLVGNTFFKAFHKKKWYRLFD